MTSKSYKQYCGLAYALDMVGERWTILIIRELIAGPRRYKDLLAGLPGISTNLLASRLRSLEERGLAIQRVLPPPAGSTVYELTSLGLKLEATLIELGKWGSQFVPPSPEDTALLNVGSYALTLKTFFRPALAQETEETYELHIDEEVMQVQISLGEIEVQQGTAWKADAIFYTDIATYLRLLTGQIAAETAVSNQSIHIEGEPDSLQRFLNLCGLPAAATG